MSFKDFDKGRLFESFLEDLQEIDREFARDITIVPDHFMQVPGIACIFPRGKEKHVPGNASGLNLSTFSYDELSEIFRQILESVDA